MTNLLTIDDFNKRPNYDIGEFVVRNRKQNINEVEANNYTNINSFKKTCQDIKDHYEQKYDSQNIEENRKQLDFQHRAIIGDPQAVKFMKDDIEDYLLANNLTNIEYPNFYNDLTDAIFNEVYGLGPLATWSKFPESQSAMILGTKIFYDIKEKELRPERFDSIEKVEGIIRALTMKDPHSQINTFRPQLEVDMLDGTRVTIMIPPRVKEHTIVFRRFLMRNFSFEEQARRNTIPEESIPLFKALARTRPNTCICGAVRTGKTTMMTTFKAERNSKDTVVIIEKHPEVAWDKYFPDQPIIQIAALENELHDIFPYTLRLDPTWVAVGETRSVEAECALLSMERGSTGYLGTYHLSTPNNFPGQWARLTMQLFPNRTYSSEVIRVAENIDIVILMEETENYMKKVTSVTEIVLDPYVLEVSTHEIMRYDWETDSWQYKYDLSEGLINKIRKINKQEAALLISTLKYLEAKNPIIGDTVKQVRGLSI